MARVKFVSNNDSIRRHCPFSAVDLSVLPSIGHKVKLGENIVGIVSDITHCIDDKHVEIYLSSPRGEL